MGPSTPERGPRVATMPVFALPAASEKVSARLWQGLSGAQVLAGCCDPGLWGWISCRSGGCVQGTGTRWASSGTQTPHHPGAGHQSGSVKPPETPTVWDCRNCQGDSPLVVLGRPRRPTLGPATTAKQVPSVARSTEPSPPQQERKAGLPAGGGGREPLDAALAAVQPPGNLPHRKDRTEQFDSESVFTLGLAQRSAGCPSRNPWPYAASHSPQPERPPRARSNPLGALISRRFHAQHRKRES